jgi:hypothetical protein
MASRTVRTMCPMNCHPTFCGMLVDVADDGRVLAVKGDPDNPDSRGFLCIRGRAAVEIPGNGRRLTRPLVRDGRRGEDRWRPVSWSEALDRIVPVKRPRASALASGSATARTSRASTDPSSCASATWAACRCGTPPSCAGPWGPTGSASRGSSRPTPRRTWPSTRVSSCSGAPIWRASPRRLRILSRRGSAERASWPSTSGARRRRAKPTRRGSSVPAPAPSSPSPWPT